MTNEPKVPRKQKPKPVPETNPKKIILEKTELAQRQFEEAMQWES